MSAQTQYELWSIGLNECGQQGDGAQKMVRHLKCIKIFDKQIKSVILGRESVYVLQKDGKYFGCGNNRNKQLGLGYDKQLIRTLSVGYKCNIHRLFTGITAKHIFCITHDNKLYASGLNESQQLGIKTARDNDWSEINEFVPCNISDIIASTYNSIVLYKDGTAYLCGREIQEPIIRNNIKRINMLTKIIDIKSGFGHFLVIDEYNALFSWGISPFGQLGHGHFDDIRSPQRIMYFGSKKIHKIACGEYHSVVLDQDKNVYCFGYNDKYQCGDKTVRKISLPFLNTALIDKDIIDIHCGGSHNVARSRNNEYWIWGHNEFHQCLCSNKDKYIKIPIRFDKRALGARFNGTIIDIYPGYQSTKILVEKQIGIQQIDLTVDEEEEYEEEIKRNINNDNDKELLIFDLTKDAINEDKEENEENEENEDIDLEEIIRKPNTMKVSINNDGLVDELKKEVIELKQKNNLLNKKINELQQENDELKQKNDGLKKEKERYRFSICSLKNVALNLPSARVQSVEWNKELIFGHLTIRSSKLNENKELIQEQAKYAMLKDGEYMIENNPLNIDCQFELNELKKIKTFIQRNHIGNINPSIEYKKNKFKSMTDILGIKQIEKCLHLKLLEGGNETYTKISIDKGTLLGQYCGNELFQYQYHEIYNGTKEEMYHLTYMMGEKLLFPNYLNPSKKRKLNEDITNKFGEEMDIYIDGISGDKSTPLLYINDGRKNINQDPTIQDRERINVGFASVLCNGWPYILVYATKKIKKGESLWLYYGDRYGLVMDERALIQDAKQKQLRMVQQILSGVDLGQQNRFEIY